MKQRAAEIEEMYSESMPQGMRMNPLFEAASADGFSDNMLYATTTQGLSFVFDALDEGVFRHIAQHFAIGAQSLAQFQAIIDCACFLTFAFD